MAKSLLICDLDGTLVDSHRGVAEAIRQACNGLAVEVIDPLDHSIIGPPLDAVLQRATHIRDPGLLAQLGAAFIECYDGGACLLTEPFDGIGDMLVSLEARGHRVALATNKRLKPTLRILDRLKWMGIFDAVETVDSRPPAKMSKSTMLRRILNDVNPSFACYLGDTADDSHEASAVGVRFIHAAWGYGLPAIAGPDLSAKNAAEVCRLIDSLAHTGRCDNAPSPIQTKPYK